MKNDKLLVLAAIGVISSLVYELFTRVLISFGIGKYSLYQLDSLIVTVNKSIPIIGFVVSSSVACFATLLLYYLSEKLGPNYIVAKSVIISIMMWVILEYFFTSVIEGKTIPPRPTEDYFIHLFGTILFGISLGLLFKRYILKLTAR